MNLTKSFLRVSSGKFLGFIVTSREIHLDPDKIKTIQDIQPPNNLKELRGLQGRLTYIGRFIVNMSGHCQSFTWLMKKGLFFVWDDTYQKVFEDIKAYLTKPPVLASPVAGKPFLLYVRAMDYSLGAPLAQKNDEGTEQAIYYLNRTLIGPDSCYNPVEKECLALVVAIQKMRHYLVRQTIHVISRVNPLRILMTNPSSLANSRLAN